MLFADDGREVRQFLIPTTLRTGELQTTVLFMFYHLASGAADRWCRIPLVEVCLHEVRLEPLILLFVAATGTTAASLLVLADFLYPPTWICN